MNDNVKFNVDCRPGMICFCIQVRWKLEEPSENNEANARVIKGILDFLNFMQSFWSYLGLEMLFTSRR